MKHPAVYLFIAIALGGPLIAPLFITMPSDYSRYEEIAKDSTLSETLSKPPLKYAAEQKREGIQKEIWIAKNGQRRHFQLEAPSSELFISHATEKKELTEKIAHPRCSYQENLSISPQSVPMQDICFFESTEALFSSQSHHLICDDVTVYRYRIEGQELPSSLSHLTPCMQGHAQSATINFSSKEMDIHTEGLKAFFPPSAEKK